MKADKAKIRRSKLYDWIARKVITLGGILIIGSVIAIIVLIVSVTFPLFEGARSELRAVVPLPDGLSAQELLAVGVDLVEIGQRWHEDSLTGYCVEKDGGFTFFEFVEPPHSAESPGHQPEAVRAVVLDRQKASPPEGTGGLAVRSVSRASGSEYTLLWSDGTVTQVEAVLTPEFDELGRRSAKYTLRQRGSIRPPQDDRPKMAAMRINGEGAATCALVTDENKIIVLRETVEESIFAEGEKKIARTALEDEIPGAITALAVSRSGGALYAGTANGCLLSWELADDGGVSNRQVVPAFRDQRAITALTMVFGDVSVAVGDARGYVTTFSPVRTETARKLRLIHQLFRHEGAVTEILPSRRNKSLSSLGKKGIISLDYTTSGKHLLSLGQKHPVNKMGYSPRGNAAIGLDTQQRLLVWQIDCPHPEISWGTLFGKVWYDSHDEPKYMWQSSGTDEPKFSLVPVIFGTLKATVYAMFFAVPLALFSAMYVSHFTSPGFKRAIKPVVEVMAAIPTVVIGFLILLWAAPLLGRWIVAVFASLLTFPVTFVAFMMFWQSVRRFDWAKRVENGYEFIVLVPVIILGAVIAAWLSGPIENVFFGGDFRQWLFSTANLRYDQLNSLVVAFGLGFAVIPIIFSISEDSLSSIPYEMTAASLAMGASRWQTVWRVILPSASPGIFAAVMIGFGRTVGETMIVFMATGNTPIMDWNPFNGFRTLSANIAVETSEAPRGGTLYRVLFLCAVLLFLMTFVLNTAAEVVRVRLRKKYGQY